MSMSIAFEARDSLRGWKSFPSLLLKSFFSFPKLGNFPFSANCPFFLNFKNFRKLFIWYATSFSTSSSSDESRASTLSLIVFKGRDLLFLCEGRHSSYVWSELISSWILISLRSLLFLIVVTFARKLSGSDQRIFLIIFESSIFSPKLNLPITTSFSLPKNESNDSSSLIFIS